MMTKRKNPFLKEGKIMKKTLITLSLVVIMVMVVAGAAYAYPGGAQGDATGYLTLKATAAGCSACHPVTKHTVGPHGGYSSTTHNCLICHGLHKASSAQLLPGATVTAVCNYCHDLTGSTLAPYYAADLATPGTQIVAAHRTFDTVNSTVYFGVYGDGSGTYYGLDSLRTVIGSTTIPGGNSTDGGNGTLDTAAQGQLSGNTFTCDSCHTPHGLRTVAKYMGESPDKVTGNKIYLTNRLLRSNVNGQTVTTYGSQWCAACHQGRDNHSMSDVNGAVYNHPVDETGPAYDFENRGLNSLASLGNAGLTPDATTDGQVYYRIDPANTVDTNFTYDPRSNKWFTGIAADALNGDAVRPDGADSGMWTNGPTCQQCHGNPRDVDKAYFTGAWASNKATPDLGAPSRTTFPHMSTNKYLLTGSNDAFCMNCHGTSNLP